MTIVKVKYRESPTKLNSSVIIFPWNQTIQASTVKKNEFNIIYPLLVLLLIKIKINKFNIIKASIK